MTTIHPGIEELLERLYVSQVEAPPGPPPAAAVTPPEIVRQAADLGFISVRGGRDPELTAKGEAAGRDVVRRHRLAEALLSDVLEMRTEEINPDACQMEHLIQQGLDERICTLLGHPRTCPHGKTIPEGECCRKAKQDQIREVTPLCDGRTGEEGLVAYLSTRDSKEIQKLMALGILPGAAIKLTRRFPSYVFQVGFSQFTVDENLAGKIHVHWGVSRTTR